MQFKGKVAIVTGSGRGIGRASAQAFAREGAKVVVTDVLTAEGQETVSLIREAGGEATFIAADMRNRQDIAALVSETVRLHGRLDFAHNNAAIFGAIADVVECTDEQWDDCIAINLTAIRLCMKHQIPEIIRSGGGAIVNTASTGGAHLVGAKAVAYCTSKHGVVGLTKATAVDFGPQGVRVNALMPGATNTAMALPDGVDTGLGVILQRTPLRRVAEPAEQANTVIWLCSDAASFVTGQSIIVDGGMSVSV